MANASGIVDPFVVKFDSGNGIATNGDDARFALAGLTQGLPGSGFGYQTGVYPQSWDGDHRDLRVQAQTSPNMTVQVLPGNYVAARSSHGGYFGCLTSAQTVTIASNASGNPRWDIVLVRNRDSGIVGDGTVTQSAFMFVIQGTPAASPTIPTGSVTDGDVVLAYIFVASGVSSITSGAISDERQMVTATGGIWPTNGADARTGSYEGQYRDNSVTNNLERWDGTASWVPVASPSTWTQFTPVLRADGSGGGALTVNIGTGATFVGRYSLTGKRLSFTYYFKWGTGPFNGQYGAIYTLLPAGLVGAGYNQWVQCHLWVNNAAYVGDFIGQGIIWANGNVMQAFFPFSTTDGRQFKYSIASSIGTPTTGIPQIAGGFAEGGDLTLNGTIEVQ